MNRPVAGRGTWRVLDQEGSSRNFEEEELLGTSMEKGRAEAASKGGGATKHMGKAQKSLFYKS